MTEETANEQVLVNTPPQDEDINAPFMDQVKKIQKASDGDFVKGNTALTEMRETLAVLRDELDSLKKTRMPSASPKTNSHNNIFDESDDYEMVLGNKELFTARMSNYFDKREQSLREQYDKKLESLQGSLSELPSNLMNNVREQAFAQRTIEDFFQENSDLDFRQAEDVQGKAVATFFTTTVGDLVAKNPGVPLNKLLNKAGEVIRKTVNLSQFMPDDDYGDDPSENFVYKRPVSPRATKGMSMNRQVIQNLLSGKSKRRI